VEEVAGLRHGLFMAAFTQGQKDGDIVPVWPEPMSARRIIGLMMGLEMAKYTEKTNQETVENTAGHAHNRAIPQISAPGCW